MKRSSILVVLIVILAVGAVTWAVVGKSGGNGESSDKKTQSTNSSQETEASLSENDKSSTTVEIKDFSYSPATLTVKKDTIVTWTNKDSVAHTVTVDNGTGPDSETLATGESYSYTFKEVGSFSYHCKPHPSMKANVIVTE